MDKQAKKLRKKTKYRIKTTNNQHAH